MKSTRRPDAIDENQEKDTSELDAAGTGPGYKRAAIHHRQKLVDHPELKYVETNLLPLCDECHNTRTARGE